MTRANKKINICIAARNEERVIENCLRSILLATNIHNFSAQIYVCLNGTTDNSLSIVENFAEIQKDQNISIMKSKEGKLLAQKKMIQKIQNNYPVFFIDADTQIHKDSLSIIYSELKKHSELLAVGGFPVASEYTGSNFFKIFFNNVLNIRSRHPKSEISSLDVSSFHQLALSDPQTINTSQKHELQSKIFFHGRLFCLRNKSYWKMPKKNSLVVGDDSFLPDYIIYMYGPNRIRIRYDAIVYFEPFISLKKHYNSYKRIYYDLYYLKKQYPEFKAIRALSSLKLNRGYIAQQTIKTRLYFSLFLLIRKLEKFFFSVSRRKNPSQLWK